MKLKFTTGRVAELVCATGKSQTFFWDVSAPGLGLRVTAAGAKSYIFESRVHGKTLRCTIGDRRAHIQLENWILVEAGLVPGASAPTPQRLVLVQKGSQT